MPNFIAHCQDGTSVSVTATSQRITLPADNPDVLVDATGANDVFVKAGDSTVVATVLSLRVPAGTIQVFNKGYCTNIALVCAATKTSTAVVFSGTGT